MSNLTVTTATTNLTNASIEDKIKFLHEQAEEMYQKAQDWEIEQSRHADRNKGQKVNIYLEMGATICEKIAELKQREQSQFHDVIPIWEVMGEEPEASEMVLDVMAVAV